LQADSHGRLLKFSEKHPGAGLINAGIYLFTGGPVPAVSILASPELRNRRVSHSLAVRPNRGKAPPVHRSWTIGTEETLSSAGQFVTANRGYFL